jgi:hypothetical protein
MDAFPDFECRVINPCFIAGNNVMKKFVSSSKMTCHMHERHRDPYKEFCNCLRGTVAPSMHKLFCQPADGGTCCARLPAKCLAIRRQQSGYASVLSDMGLSVRYAVNRFRRAWASRWQPDVKIHLVLYPHVRPTRPSNGHEFSTKLHSPHAKIETHCVLTHLTKFLEAPRL